jgi:RHS repeat-associated protein
VLTDHQMREAVLTDITGAVIHDVLTTPFGELVSQTGSRAITSDAGFPGQRMLMEISTNVSYNRHRHYDASFGRSLQPDPLGLIDGPNRYAYAGSNPVMWSDPRGEFIPLLAGALLGGSMGLLSELHDNGWNVGCVSPNAVLRGALGGAFGAGIGARLYPMLARGPFEFSHWIPKRVIKRLPESLQRLDGKWNGNIVTPWRHFKHDPFRYPKNNRQFGDRWKPVARQLDRVPGRLKGASIGTALQVQIETDQ